MKVIGFCGLPGSGKSTAINALRDIGIIINMGDIVRNEAKNRNIKPTGHNLGEIAKDLREKEGQGIIAQKCVDLIKTFKNEVVFIDGIRSIAEIQVFRKHWKFPLVEIISKRNLRYKRIKERARSDDSISFNDIIEREKREIGFGIKEVIKEANYRIRNNSTIEKLELMTRKLIKKILSTY